MPFEAFDDEQYRVAANLEQQYRLWVQEERVLAAMPYGMRIAKRNNTEYLYEMLDRNGNAKSLGRLTSDLQDIFDGYRHRKDEAKANIAQSKLNLEQIARLYRAMRLPVLGAEAGAILREADRQSILGTHIIVVGTNSMPAYNMEAGGFIREAPEETKDFDVAWVKDEPDDTPSFWNTLKAVDSTYTVNTERPFQALNRKRFEVEMLVAPSRAAALHRYDNPKPIPIPEQEWLLHGRFVDRVVVDRDGLPARLVVPDPRYFAIMKLWLSENRRNILKREKDLKQGMALLDATANEMPHFPMDDVFVEGLPTELRPYFDRWKAQWNPKPRRW